MASSMLTAEVSASASTEADVDGTLKTMLHSCANDPDFAIICDFLQKFSKDLGLEIPNFKLLLHWLTKTDEVSPQLREMQIKLLRKTRKTVHEKSWESALSKFCFTYSSQDAWEIERFGYKNSSVKVKLRVLRELLECQFERNTKFRAKILTLSADSLRSKPIGRDRLGHAYWVTQDNDCNIRIYQEHLDEEIWQVVATNREEFVNLIKRLRGSEVVLPCTDISLIDEDTASSSSRIEPGTVQKQPPPEEKDDSQEDEHKVPKLSIKLVHGKNSKDTNTKDFGKGEEELAAEEDEKLLQKSKPNFSEAVESDGEEFEEVEEEYEDDDETDNVENDDAKNTKKNENILNQNLQKDLKVIDQSKKVKPLLISQNKVLSSEKSSTSNGITKKRSLDQVDPSSPPPAENKQINLVKKSKSSMMDSKHLKVTNRSEGNNEKGEEDYDESVDEEDNVEEEIEEEDIDSVAAEEDENEEKQFEDDDDDEEEEVGEEISDPVIRVMGEGSGKDCNVGNNLYIIEYDSDYSNSITLSDVIVEDICYVWGEGYGKECLVGNDKTDSDTTITSDKNNKETINNTVEVNIDNEVKTSLPKENKGNLFFGESGCLDLSPSKIPILSSDVENGKNISSKKSNNTTENNEDTENKQDSTKEDINKINGENNHKLSKNDIICEKKEEYTNDKIQSSDDNRKTKEEINLENSTKDDNQNSCKNLTIAKIDFAVSGATVEQTHANKMSALESLKKELRESKQKLLEKNAILIGDSNNTKISTSSVYNRKRRLTDRQTTLSRPSNSESEIDIYSENIEELVNDHDLGADDQIGGKRIKMRPKQTNSELRKKIEAQKMNANDETTSSSGGEEELRKRKKTFSKSSIESSIIKSELKMSNTEHVNEAEQTTVEPSSKNERCSGDSVTLVQQCSMKKPTQITPTKSKPTLAEIIEKKLKKTPEKTEKDCVADPVDNVTSKPIFTSPNKNPITKPLKKNLLTQIRQEESDEDSVPRKRTISQDLSSPVVTDTKTYDTTCSAETKICSNNNDQKETITTECQKENRIGEEIIKKGSPEEEREIKKENTAAEDNDKTTDVIKKEENLTDDVEKRSTENSTPISGRRSGRRSGIAPTYVQPKRNRGSTKNATKQEISDGDKADVKNESPSKEVKVPSTTLKLNAKGKNEVGKDKESDEKEILKDEDNDDIKDEKNMLETKKSETSKTKSCPTTKTPAKGVRKQREVDATNIIDADSETPVRQSRRIAQQKIREEAERRKLEEIALRTMKQELKKKKKAEKRTDPTVVPPTEPSSESEEESDVEIKRKVQRKKCPGKNGNWSSGSEEQEEPDEEDEEPPHYETDPGSPLFESDHEFSPESEIEDESQVVPMKRARTVRKEDADDGKGPDEEEEACQKCNKSDHPEWILLCDNCDKGYHCSCLSPVLFYIPEGDWYCPPCQQEQLIKALENQLKEFDDFVENKKEEEKLKRLAEEEKARLEKEEEAKKHKNKRDRKNQNSSEEDLSEEDENETSTNSDSGDSETKRAFVKSKERNRSRNSKSIDKRNYRDRRRNVTRSSRIRKQKHNGNSDSDSQHTRTSKSDSESSSSSSSSYSESDNEPIYKLRKRRQINVSYRLNEYDDLINSALKKEMDEAAGAGNLGRGKDISTIIEADKEEKARQKQLEHGEFLEKTKADTDDGKIKETKQNSLKAELDTTKEKQEDVEEGGSDAEPIIRKFNTKPTQKKKPRKLTTLDISSEDDDGSDEDFKGSSIDDEEEEDEEDTSISASNSDSSLDVYKRHGKYNKKRRKAARRAFRERCKDRRFVVDESDDEESQRPKSKKKRKDDSDYTESEPDDDDISELSENIDSAELCDDTTTDESDGAWQPNKRKKAKKLTSSAVQKSPKMKKNSYSKKPKKVEYSDDDTSASEEDENDDENEDVGSGKGMGKQPRSQPLKTSSNTVKPKGKGSAPLKTKKKKKSSEEDESPSGSEDSTRRTRGRRYAYIEDFDEESSDGGIKPGVKRPDTPPEEREKFIKRQEEIKRMLAEKNAEGAKLVATPRLTPIKTDTEKDKRSPAKVGGDSLSTVPMSVIRQAKVLDIDYLQRRGENLDDLSNDVGEVDDDFDDADLPDDLPEDMDEDAIARMVEEEEEFGAAAVRDLPAPDEVLRPSTSVKPKLKEVEKSSLPGNTTSVASNPPQVPTVLPTTGSGLQEPVRKRLPMPTIHPPLLRHQFLMHESMSNTHHLIQRQGGPPTSHLLHNALSAPLTQPLDRNYPPSAPSPSHHSLISRMTHNIPLQPTATHGLSSTRHPSPNIAKTLPLSEQSTAQEKSTTVQSPSIENKPRGRRKKITPLRDSLQKQQTAAAVTAATATNSALASAIVKNNDSVSTPLPSSVIKSSSPAAKLPMQTSVITSMPPTSHTITNRPGLTMPPISGAYIRPDGPRFYDSPGSRLPQTSIQRLRGPPQLPPSLLPPHPANRSSYGPPPPLKGSNSAPPVTSSSSASGSIRNPVHHVPSPYLGVPPNARHSTPHLNMYRPPIYGNPNFGPRVNLRPPNIHAPEYSAGSRAYSPYGFYPPPPPLTTPGQRPGPAPRPSAQMPPVQPPPTQSPASVIVSTITSGRTPSRPVPPPPVEISEPGPKPAMMNQELEVEIRPTKSPSPSRVLPQIEEGTAATVAEPRKKLTTLQAYTTSIVKKSPIITAGESSGSQSPPAPSADVIDESSTHGASDDTPTAEQSLRSECQPSEFSGLVSYFSSQHDDYNT